MAASARIRPPFLAALISGFTLLLYWPALHGSFVYDDLWYLVQNPAVRTLNIASFFTNPETAAAPSSELGGDVYRPLGTLAFSLAYHAWGLRAWPYHLANLLFHLLNGFLFYGVLNRLLNEVRSAICGALVFLWHPVQVESVAWVSQLTGLIGATGFLMVLLGFVSKGDLSRKQILGGWTAFAAAALFKETVLILPFILLLVRPASTPGRRRFMAGTFVIAFAYLVLRHAMLHHWSQLPEGPGSFTMNVALGLLGFSVYLGKLVLPAALRVSYHYPAPDPAAILAAGLVSVAYGRTVWAAWRPSPSLARALAWVVVALLPVLQLIPIRAFVAERFLYIPMMGCAWLTGWLWKSSAKIRPGLLLWMVLLVVQTARAVPAWRKEQSLWAQAVRHDPTNAFAHACYAQSLGDDPRAETEYKTVLLNQPTPGIRYAAFQNLASWYHERGKAWKANYWRSKAKAAKGES